LEDPKNGKILPKGLHVPISKKEIAQAKEAAKELGEEIFHEVYFTLLFFFFFFLEF